MGIVSDGVRKFEGLADVSKNKKSTNNSKKASLENESNSGKVILGEKGTTSNTKRYVSRTNVEKAKELLRSVKGKDQTYDDIRANGFGFSYDDEELPTKFKELFGKKGVMDLLADALMTKDKSSTKAYSFADMRNELKIYYRKLKLETFKTGTGLDKNSMENVVDLSNRLEDDLKKYKFSMDEALVKLKKISRRSKSIDKITKLIKLISIAISLLGSVTAQPEIVAVATVISSINSVIRFSNELYLHVKIKSIKGSIKKYQKDINSKYKQLKKEYIKALSNGEGASNKTLIIKKYNQKSLEDFNKKCKDISGKYHVKISRFKIWSKELNKQKEIFKCGISNLMTNKNRQ